MGTELQGGLSAKGFQGRVFLKIMQGMGSNELAVLGTSSGFSLCLRGQCHDFKIEQLKLQ